MAEAITPTDVLSNLARHIDISCVQAFHSEQDIRSLADAARAGSFVSAHVLPNWLPLLRELLAGSDTLAGGPAGFPSGGSTTSTKLAEVASLLAAGAQEVDVVVNIGRLRSMDLAYVTAELREVASFVAGAVPLRVILEVGHLTDDELRSGCDCALEAGIPWIKTGTGWSGHPPTLHHIALIAERVAGAAEIKAAGGIRELATVRAMADLGVTRFGVNATVARNLVSEAASQHSSARSREVM